MLDPIRKSYHIFPVPQIHSVIRDWTRTEGTLKLFVTESGPSASRIGKTTHTSKTQFTRANRKSRTGVYSMGTRAVAFGVACWLSVFALVNVYGIPTEASDTYDMDGEGSGELALAVNGVGFDLLREFRKENNVENIVFSPLSISGAFSVLHFATLEATKRQIGAVFGFKDDAVPKQLQAKMNSLGQAANSETTIANRVYTPSELEIRPAFVELVGRDSFEQLDFKGDPSGSLTSINAFVGEVTEGEIPKLLSDGAVNRDTQLVVVNAVFFGGEWEKGFDKKDTVKGTFNGVGGKQDVDFMTLKVERDEKEKEKTFEFYMKWGAIQDGYEMVELPYKGGRFSMFIALPTEQDGWKEVEEKMAKAVGSGTDIFGSGMVPVQFKKVQLPKWDMEFEMSGITDYLKQLGVIELFGSGNFGGLTDDTVVVSDVIHKAKITVDEKGTVAAAATAIVLTRSLPPPPRDFIVDHPFLYYIIDKQDNTILFQGTVTNL